MRRYILTFTTLMFLSHITHAQQKRWTFQQCLDTALKRNISVNQTILSNELNKISLAQSKANRIPDLNAGANEGLNFGKNINPTTNTYVIQTYNSTNFSISSGITLFNGFQNSRTIQQNARYLEAGKSDIESTKNTVILSITTAYLQVLFAYEILATAQSQLESDTAQVDRTEKMVNAGKIPESNLFQIKAQYATDKLSVVNAQSQLDMARVTLMQLMEIPVTDSFDVVKPVLSDPVESLLQTRDNIYRKALTVQPQITSAALRTENSLLGIKIAEGARWPRISMSGNINTNFAASNRSSGGSGVNPYSVPFFDQIWNNLGESVGLSLSIPIYSNRQIRGNIDRAKINSLTTQLNEKNTQIQLRKSIEQAYTDLRSAMKKFDASKEQLLYEESSYKNLEHKYNVGMSSAIDFLIEKNNYYLAQSNLIQAKYDYIFKSKILDFYQGITITF